jgi:hypothetical protein
MKTGKWDNKKQPLGCEEPYGRGHQCDAPHGEENGNWNCAMSHGEHVADHKHAKVIKILSNF